MQIEQIVAVFNLYEHVFFINELHFLAAIAALYAILVVQPVCLSVSQQQVSGCVLKLLDVYTGYGILHF